MRDAHRSRSAPERRKAGTALGHHEYLTLATSGRKREVGGEWPQGGLV